MGPSAISGPLEAGDLPLSQDPRRELERLRIDFAEHAEDGDGQRGSDWVETDWERDALHAKAAEFWRRARSELGSRYAVGFLAAAMRRPVWSPGELDDDNSGDDRLDIEVCVGARSFVWAVPAFAYAGCAAVAEQTRPPVSRAHLSSTGVPAIHDHHRRSRRFGSTPAADGGHTCDTGVAASRRDCPSFPPSSRRRR